MGILLLVVKLVLAYFTVAAVTWRLFRYSPTYHRSLASRGDGFLAVMVPLAWPISWPVLAAVFVGRYVGRTLLPSVERAVTGVERAVAWWLFARLEHRDEYGELWSMPSPYGRRMRVVRVRDGTGVYRLPVPPDVATAKAAVAWTYRMDPNHYDPVRV